MGQNIGIYTYIVSPLASSRASIVYKQIYFCITNYNLNNNKISLIYCNKAYLAMNENT
jgi:hypothetical protein